MMTSIVYSFSMFVQLPLLHLVLLPAPSNGWCLNPGCLIAPFPIHLAPLQGSR